MPPAIVDALNGHCVDVDPVEIAVIWAYPQWRWCPVGVMQSYAAYTPSLDRLDAAGFANARTGPDRVLREADVDDRRPQPRLGVAGRDALAAVPLHGDRPRRAAGRRSPRIPDRCGRPRALGTIHSPSAATVDDSRRRRREWSSSPRSAGFRSTAASVSRRSSDGRTPASSIVNNGTATYRVVPDTLGDGLILDVPAVCRLRSAVQPRSGRSSSMLAEISGTPVPFSVTLVGVPIRAN